mmetsp:Transcript_7260/g.8283  ORF Transcript_7260/g.8283 Transcript_7260/m.8283 type:complete len:82 (+) Transcript_7260:132-377(+)
MMYSNSLCLILILILQIMLETYSLDPSSSTTETTTHNYKILSEKVLFSRWRSIVSRVVEMPNGNEVDYDVSFRNAYRWRKE